MQKIFKNERGSISLFVLLSALFFLVVVTSVGVSFKNKERSIDSQFEKIKAGYEKDVGNEETIYAEESVKRTVTFDPNGGNVSTISKVVKIGENYGELPTPTRVGYTFKGWNGKNLFDEETLLSAIDGATKNNEGYIFIANKAYQLYGHNKGFPILNFIGNKQYTLSARGYLETGTQFLFQFQYDDETYDNAYISGNEMQTIRVTSNLNKIIDKLIVRYNVSGIVHILNIQLEEGSTATEYEPYFVTSSTKVTQNNDNKYVLTAIWEPNE